MPRVRIKEPTCRNLKKSFSLKEKKTTNILGKSCVEERRKGEGFGEDELYLCCMESEAPQSLAGSWVCRLKFRFSLRWRFKREGVIVENVS